MKSKSTRPFKIDFGNDNNHNSRHSPLSSNDLGKKIRNNMNPFNKPNEHNPNPSNTNQVNPKGKSSIGKKLKDLGHHPLKASRKLGQATGLISGSHDTHSGKPQKDENWSTPVGETNSGSNNDWRSPESALMGSKHNNNSNNTSNNNNYNNSGTKSGNDNQHKSPLNSKRPQDTNSVLRGANRALKHPLKNGLGSVFKSSDLGFHSGNKKKSNKGVLNKNPLKGHKKIKKIAKKTGKAGLFGHPLIYGSEIWLAWHIGRQALADGANSILNKVPILNALYPGLKKFVALSKAAAKAAGKLAMGAIKGGAHLIGKAIGGIAHGIGIIGHGIGSAAHGAAHIVAHPIASGASLFHGATNAFSTAGLGSAIMSHLGPAGVMKVASIGIASISLVGAGDYVFNTRTSNGPIGCMVQNIKQDVTDSISGTDGEWTKKGTKAYNLAKKIYIEAKHEGCDDKHAAAVVGNAEHEGASTGVLDEHQGGGQSHVTASGQASGIFQFEQKPKYGWSLQGQVKSIFANGLSPSDKSEWEHSSGSVAELAHTFETKFERGGEPAFDQREKLANRAYSMFNGIGGKTGAADDNDEAASAGAKGACSKNSSSDTSASDVVKFAQRYLGLKYQLGGNSVPISKGKPKSEVNPTDCNKFAWAVERGSGHAVPSNMPGNCDDSIQRLHKYEVPASKAHAGSLVINHYHAMVMMTPWRGIKGTKLIQEGGGGNDVNEGHSYYWSMASYLGSKRYFFNIPKR